MSDPIVFLKETYPALFAKGVALLQAKADEGSAKHAAALADVKGAKGVVFISVEGSGDVHLKLEDGTMTAVDSADPGDITLAVAAPAEAMEMLLGEAESAGELDDEERSAKRAVMTASKKLQDALANDSLLFHVIVEDVPDLGTVTTRIGLNAPEPPADPKFTATLKYEDLEAAQAGELNAQQMFMGGKLRMAGDYSRALQLGMQLMQMAQQ